MQVIFASHFPALVTGGIHQTTETAVLKPQGPKWMGCRESSTRRTAELLPALQLMRVMGDGSRSARSWAAPTGVSSAAAPRLTDPAADSNTTVAVAEERGDHRRCLWF